MEGSQYSSSPDDDPAAGSALDWRRLTDANTEPIWILGRDGIEYANPAASELFQRPAEELLGARPVEWLPPADRYTVARAREELDRSGRTRVVGRIGRPDGSHVPVEFQATVLEPGRYLMAGRDMSGWIAEWDEARAAQKDLLALFDNANDAIYTHDLDGLLTYVNHPAELLTGYSARELKTMNALDLIAPEYHAIAGQAVQEQLAGATPRAYEMELLTKSGARIGVEVSSWVVRRSGEPIAVQGIVRDISARLAAAEALERAQHEAQSLASAARELTQSLDQQAICRVIAEHARDLSKSTAVWLAIRGADGSLRMELESGFQTHRFLGAEIRFDVGLAGAVQQTGRIAVSDSPVDDKRLNKTLQQVLEADQITAIAMAPVYLDGELQALITVARRDGEPYNEVDLSALTRLAELSAGAVRNAFLYDQLDIANSDLAGALAQSQELAEAAQQAARAKAEFLATMSHEIRTPLSGIVGMLDILRASGLPAEQIAHAEVADRCAKDLLALVNDILDFSKMEAGAMVVESIDFRPREVIGRAADVLAPQAHAKGLTVQTSVDPALDPALRGDPARLRQILLNLISNAVKFTETGKVEVGAAVAERDGAAVVRYWVRDTGIGLSPRAKERLFLPFAQADGSTTRKYGGTGLGLAISKQLVELMAGEFGVESIEGQGSTFWFTLPLLPGSEARLLESAVPQHQPAAASPFAARFVMPPRVLVAEDNDVNQRIARLQLRRIGIDPIVASNGREAIEAFQGSRPDIILMDCQMPGVDGFEATRAIRRLERGTGTRVPIVAMTANAVHGDREACLAAGMDDYLAKPVSFDGIQRALGAWLPGFVAEAGDAGPDTVPTTAEMEEPTMTILEAETLTALQALSDDDDDLLQELVDIYLAEAPALIRAIRAASAEGDAEGLERAAHSLKGSSANMGALRLASKALALEELGRAGSIDGASELAAELDALFEEASGALTSWLSAA